MLQQLIPVKLDPVIGFGIVGPPESCIVNGYDNSGDIVIGWSFFQGDPEFNAGVEFEENGYFRKFDWYENTGGVIILGEKHEKPPLGQTYRKALKLMVHISRTDTVFDRVNGIAAYDSWAEALAMDGEFPSDNEQVLRSRFMHTNMIVGFLAEMRWYGNIGLQHMADPNHLPHTVSGDLLHAAAYYADIHALMWRLWDLMGGIGNQDGYLELAKPDVRRKMIEVVKEAKEMDEQAVQFMESALNKL